MTNETQFLRLTTVAERLDCSRGTVYRMIKRGELPGVVIAGTTRVRASDLEDYIECQIRKSTALRGVGTERGGSNTKPFEDLDTPARELVSAHRAKQRLARASTN